MVPQSSYSNHTSLKRSSPHNRALRSSHQNHHQNQAGTGHNRNTSTLSSNTTFSNSVFSNEFYNDDFYFYDQEPTKEYRDSNKVKNFHNGFKSGKSDTSDDLGHKYMNDEEVFISQHERNKITRQSMEIYKTVSLQNDISSLISKFEKNLSIENSIKLDDDLIEDMNLLEFDKRYLSRKNSLKRYSEVRPLAIRKNKETPKYISINGENRPKSPNLKSFDSSSSLFSKKSLNESVDTTPANTPVIGHSFRPKSPIITPGITSQLVQNYNLLSSNTSIKSKSGSINSQSQYYSTLPLANDYEINPPARQSLQNSSYLQELSQKPLPQCPKPVVKPYSTHTHTKPSLMMRSSSVKVKTTPKVTGVHRRVQSVEQTMPMSKQFQLPPKPILPLPKKSKVSRIIDKLFRRNSTKKLEISKPLELKSASYTPKVQPLHTKARPPPTVQRNIDIPKTYTSHNGYVPTRPPPKSPNMDHRREFQHLIPSPVIIEKSIDKKQKRITLVEKDLESDTQHGSVESLFDIEEYRDFKEQEQEQEKTKKEKKIKNDDLKSICSSNYSEFDYNAIETSNFETFVSFLEEAFDDSTQNGSKKRFTFTGALDKIME